MTYAAKAPPLRAKSAAKTASVTVPFRTVLFSMVVLWAAYFVLISIRGYIGEFDFQFEMAVRRAGVTVCAIALTVLLWLMLRLFDARSLWIKVAAAILLAVPVALAIGQINHVAFQDMEAAWQKRFVEKNGMNLRRDDAGNILVDLPPQAGTSETESIIVAPAKVNKDVWRSVIDIALGRYFLLLAWASLYFALLAGYQASASQRREQEFRTAAKAAELRSLRYQVNPHFLFNTLNSLSALVMTGKPQRAEEMIQSISRFYRHSLADDPTSDVRLADEFALQREYLEIEAVRFPDRLRVVFDLPHDLADARVPGMILQPLVENSVKYAVSPVAREVTIRVAAREEFDRLVVTVSDDGPGVPDGTPHGFGIGLANVRDRLEARFGSDIVLASAPIDGGYRTEFRVPLTRKAGYPNG